MKRRIIPYSAKLATARKLRKNMTLGEVTLWQAVRRKQICGIKFSRQIRIYRYIVDFYSKELQLAIEVDGSSHDSYRARIRDQIRENHLKSKGVKFIRFRDEEVRDNLPKVVKVLTAKVESLIDDSFPNS